MRRIVWRDWQRTEHDDFILNVQLGPYSEAVPIYAKDGLVLGWRIQPFYE